MLNNLSLFGLSNINVFKLELIDCGTAFHSPHISGNSRGLSCLLCPPSRMSSKLKPVHSRLMNTFFKQTETQHSYCDIRKYSTSTFVTEEGIILTLLTLRYQYVQHKQLGNNIKPLGSIHSWISTSFQNWKFLKASTYTGWTGRKDFSLSLQLSFFTKLLHHLHTIVKIQTTDRWNNSD